jgi:signal-transduction protein with cAMP-binding, CBS, and nucleotidyltransferase domain
MKVREIMIQPVQTCHVHTDVATASRRMKESATGMLVVLDDHGRAKGVVTDRDLALLIGLPGHDIARLPVRKAMSRHLYACNEGDTLHEALATMARRHVRRLPVMSTDGDLSAVLSIDDIILWAVHQGVVTPRELATALRTICGLQAVPDDSEPPTF